MLFSIIIPSYNQVDFIEITLQNIVALKKLCAEQKIELEVILCDNQSNEKVQAIIQEYKSYINFLIVEPDKGQYDAINKGLTYVTGNYWTWLNTDDFIELDGFLEIVNYLILYPVDYIYGDINIINRDGSLIGKSSSGNISIKTLTQKDASISQPGSFFNLEFTNKIGKLNAYKFAFDYEYILRILKSNGKIAKINSVVAQFRYYQESKSGSQNSQFLIEQLQIAKLYGSKFFSKLSIILRLRILKRKLIN